MARGKYNECIDACNVCATACSHCAVACLQEDDPKAMARCIALAMDCVAVCQFAAVAMARGSERVHATCQLCADTCQSCSDECTKHPMAHCKQCAEACRICAERCRSMAQQPRGQFAQSASRPA